MARKWKWKDRLTQVLLAKPAEVVQEACQVLEKHGCPVKELKSKLYPEYIRDKSVQPRIPTVNNILQKWRSKTSSVGMVKILLSLCMNTITPTGCRRQTVTDCDTYGRRLRGGYVHYRFKEAYEAHGSGNCQFHRPNFNPKSCHQDFLKNC